MSSISDQWGPPDLTPPLQCIIRWQLRTEATSADSDCLTDLICTSNCIFVGEGGMLCCVFHVELPFLVCLELASSSPEVAGLSLLC